MSRNSTKTCSPTVKIFSSIRCNSPSFFDDPEALCPFLPPFHSFFLSLVAIQPILFSDFVDPYGTPCAAALAGISCVTLLSAPIHAAPYAFCIRDVQYSDAALLTETHTARAFRDPRVRYRAAYRPVSCSARCTAEAALRSRRFSVAPLLPCCKSSGRSQTAQHANSHEPAQIRGPPDSPDTARCGASVFCKLWKRRSFCAPL